MAIGAYWLGDYKSSVSVLYSAANWCTEGTWEGTGTGAKKILMPDVTTTCTAGRLLAQEHLQCQWDGIALSTMTVHFPSEVIYGYNLLGLLCGKMTTANKVHPFVVRIACWTTVVKGQTPPDWYGQWMATVLSTLHVKEWEPRLRTSMIFVGSVVNKNRTLFG